MDFITNIINKAGSESTYVASVSEWLKKQSALYNDKLHNIINGDNNDPFVVGNNVISAQQLRDVINGELSEEYAYLDEIGEQFTVNSLVANISNQNAVFIIKACALEALAVGQTPVECNSVFFNNLSVQLGDITVDNNAYCSYISSILLSNGSTAYKVRQIINGDMPEQAGFISTPSEQYTGVNPFIGFCNNINIDWSDPLQAIGQAAVTTWNVLKNVYDGLIDPAVKWVKKKATGIIKTIVNPIDISNVEGGQDLSFTDGYYQVQLNVPCPSDWVNNHLNQYCCVVVLGATLYLHITSMGIDYMYVKKHLYDPDVAETLINAFSSSTPNSWDKIPAVLNSGADFRAEIQEDSDELFLYKGMLRTEKLIYAGINIASGRSIDYFVEDYSLDDFNPVINAMSYNNTDVSNVSSVTNVSWVNEINKGNVAAYISAYQDLISNMVDNLGSDSTFYPYSWVDGPLQGSYAVKTDVDNVEAVSNVLKTFVTTVIVIVAGVIAIKSVARIKSLARTAMRNYELAYYNPATDAATLKKLRRKANILQVLSGASFKVPSYLDASASNNDEIVRLIKG